jgi:23S rRNA (cytidine2498-2'-O)-methyltransferase
VRIGYAVSAFAIVLETPCPAAVPPRPWLIRVAPVFSEWMPEILESIGARVVGKPVGREYRRVELAAPGVLVDPGRPPFVRWNMPLQHQWPCRPEEMSGFIEKAAGAMLRKFGGSGLRSIRVGAVDPAMDGGYYRRLASNLRGRALQVFSGLEAGRDAESRPPDEPTLFCLVGKEGLFCGVASSFECQGFHPGGTRYTSQNLPGTISRAGAKLVEAFHHLRLLEVVPREGGHWLELGASPGGMTSELLRRGMRVTAVDRAALDERLGREARLSFYQRDVAEYSPATGQVFDGLLCDMNGAAMDSLAQVVRLSRHLTPGAPVIFTLKAANAVDFSSLAALYHQAVESATASGLALVSRAHLTYNRLEFSLFFSKL